MSVTNGDISITCSKSIPYCIVSIAVGADDGDALFGGGDTDDGLSDFVFCQSLVLVIVKPKFCSLLRCFFLCHLFQMTMFLEAPMAMTMRQRKKRLRRRSVILALFGKILLVLSNNILLDLDFLCCTTIPTPAVTPHVFVQVKAEESKPETKQESDDGGIFGSDESDEVCWMHVCPSSTYSLHCMSGPKHVEEHSRKGIF